MRPQFHPLLRPLEWSEVASLEWVFEGDPKGSHHSIEHDLSLFIWPLTLWEVDIKPFEFRA